MVYPLYPQAARADRTRRCLLLKRRIGPDGVLEVYRLANEPFDPNRVGFRSNTAFILETNLYESALKTS